MKDPFLSRCMRGCVPTGEMHGWACVVHEKDEHVCEHATVGTHPTLLPLPLPATCILLSALLLLTLTHADEHALSFHAAYAFCARNSQSVPASFCSSRDAECTYTHCCDNGHVCYQRGPNYARCMAPGTCRDVWAPAEGSCEVASVVTECAAQGGECTLSGCCVDPDLRCFLKNERCARGVGSHTDHTCCRAVSLDPPSPRHTHRTSF